MLSDIEKSSLNNNIMKKFILAILLMFQIICVKGQTEFLVKVNPTTGIFSIVDSLPGVHFWASGTATFDSNNHHYLFWGTDFSGNKRLYCIDALTGNIISQPLFAINTMEYHYDNSSNTLFALSTSGGISLISINISTAATNTIAALPVTSLQSSTTFIDELNHTYVLQEGGYIYSVSLITGNITTIVAPTQLYGFQFDNNTGNPYGLDAVSAINSEVISSINLNNGNYSYVDTLHTYGYTYDEFAYSEINNIYTFCSTGHLYSVDVNTGNTVSSPLFPVGITSQQNVIGLNYDNSSGILYSLHWGTITTSEGIKIYQNENTIAISPNPFTSFTTITFSEEQKNTLLKITDMLGNTILQTIINGKQSTIDLSGAAKGIYFAEIIDANKNAVNKKIVVQ